MPCRRLKDPNDLSLFSTVLQKESRLFWVQMVERRKERPQPFEVSRYLSCIHRVAKEMNAIRSGELPIHEVLSCLGICQSGKLRVTSLPAFGSEPHSSSRFLRSCAIG